MEEIAIQWTGSVVNSTRYKGIVLSLENRSLLDWAMSCATWKSIFPLVEIHSVNARHDRRLWRSHSRSRFRSSLICFRNVGTFSIFILSRVTLRWLWTPCRIFRTRHCFWPTKRTWKILKPKWGFWRARSHRVMQPVSWTASGSLQKISDGSSRILTPGY